LFIKRGSGGISWVLVELVTNMLTKTKNVFLGNHFLGGWNGKHLNVIPPGVCLLLVLVISVQLFVSCIKVEWSCPIRCQREDILCQSLFSPGTIWDGGIKGLGAKDYGGSAQTFNDAAFYVAVLWRPVRSGYGWLNDWLNVKVQKTGWGEVIF
jgi:hypothetical protein